MVSSRATRCPEIEVSGIAARHSRVASSTMFRIRNRRPEANWSWTKSSDQRAFGVASTRIGARIRELRQRLARQAEAMREFGLVDPEEAPPPLPSDRQLPVVSAISFAEVLEALDELETFPEQPPSLAAPAETVATATYFAYLRNAEAGKLRPYASGRKEDPEPLDSDPSFRPG
jgi:hypothetical protein